MKTAAKSKTKTMTADETALAVIPREAGKAGRPKGKMRPLSTRRSIAVQRITRDCLAAAPWIARSDLSMVRRYAEMQILIQALYYEIHMHGILLKNREPRLILDTYRRMVQTQARLADSLGLSPLARKQLAQAAQGDDLAAAMAKRVQRDDA
jgi:phage terminase small subunit